MLARRLAAQRLTVAADLRGVAGSWSLQDSPPGSAALAVHARAPIEPGAVDAALERRELVAVYNARTATALVPADELGAYTAAQLPREERALRFVLGRSVPRPGEGTPAAEAVARTSEIVLEALDGRALSRDELHEALRRRLPADLLPWCPGCKSHHARRGLLVLACLRGELCLAGRAGRQPAFARPDQWLGAPPDRPPGAAAELVRRYLEWHGPSTPAHFAEWAGVSRAQATAAWKTAAEEPEPEPPAAPPHRGVALLPAGDPLLQSRDRERLVADPAHREQLWTGVMAPGAVLADGAIAGLWRARKRGATLEVAVTTWCAVDGAALRAAAEGIAPHRGCSSASVVAG